MNFNLCALIVVFFSLNVSADVVVPTYSPQCILQAILQYKNIAERADIAIPSVSYASTTSLQEFQDIVEPQFGIRPDLVVNVYVPQVDRIFLLDDAGYYSKFRRYIDDSLAHELTHFVQVRYQGTSIEGRDERLEIDAVSTQTWFRETYMDTGISPCRL